MILGVLLLISLGGAIALWLSVAPSVRQSGQVAGESKFHITLDGPSEVNPDKVLLLSMDVDGTLRDVLAHEVEEDSFKSLLREGNPMKPCLLRIQIYDEEKTSVAILSKTLAKLRVASDSQRETFIFIYLDKHVRP